MMRMSSKAQILACVLLCTCLPATSAKAGSETAKKSRTISVTGCLQQGEVVDRFHIVGRDGKAYALRSTRVRLAEHLGHNVTIKGELKHDPKRDDYDFEGSEVNEEYGKGKIADFVDLEVTDLKMVAASCK
jgi:hypothetical protein